MPLQNDEFKKYNTKQNNILCAKILLFALALGPLLAIFSALELFEISYRECIAYEVLIVCLCAGQIVAVYFTKHQNFAKYWGLAGVAVILGVMGMHAHVGIYISYAFAVFLSCLYYSVHLTLFVSVINCALMLISLYFKFQNQFNEGMVTNALHAFAAYGAGFLIEFFFAFLIAEKIARQSQTAINLFNDKNLKLEKTQNQIINFIPKILESHEIFTGHHIGHTRIYIDIIANAMKSLGFYEEILTPEYIQILQSSALLHDVGKVHIPDNILNKPGRYVPEEFEMMKTHPVEGARIIPHLPIIGDGNFNKTAFEMALFHHEKFNDAGEAESKKGYPNLGVLRAFYEDYRQSENDVKYRGKIFFEPLKTLLEKYAEHPDPDTIHGNDIPLCARIMAAADVFDALRSRRPYKEVYDIEKTMAIFEESRGTHFESCIVDAVLSQKDLLVAISKNVSAQEQAEDDKEYEWRQKIREWQKK